MSNGNWILVFGFCALFLFALLYYAFDRRRSKHGDTAAGPFSITFARLFGLITVAVLGTALALLGTEQQFATSAFTLLGTIAGYLAGAKSTPGAAGGASEEHL